MRNKYFEIVKDRIANFLKSEKNVIMTQGIFKNKNKYDLKKI